MTKTELVKKVAEKAEINQNLSATVIEAVFESLSESLGQGDNFNMIGFGSLKVVERNERRGRNPKTGEEITIPAQKTVRFSPGKKLKELVNPKKEKAAGKKKAKKK